MNSLTVLKWKSKLQRRQITKQILKNPLNKIELKQKYCLLLTDKSVQPCEESSPFLLCAQRAGIRWQNLRVKEKGARHFKLFKIGRKSQDQSIQYNTIQYVYLNLTQSCCFLSVRSHFFHETLAYVLWSGRKEVHALFHLLTLISWDASQ